MALSRDTTLQLGNAPAGKAIEVGNHAAYLATASGDNSRRDVGLLFITDITGFGPRAQLLVDQYAAKGYTTLMIDIYNGDQISHEEFPSVNLDDWKAKGRNGRGPHTTVEIDPIVAKGVEYLKKDLGYKRVGALGFSFGGRYALRSYTSGVDVAFVADPAFATAGDLALIKGPISFAVSEHDVYLTQKLRFEFEDALREAGAVYQMFVYSGVYHGFSVHADRTKKLERVASDQSFAQAIGFFDAWVGDE